jgi:alpha-L-rhamnosidase
MRIYDLRLNGITNPLGYRLDTLSCSWKTTDTKSSRQIAACIEVASDCEFRHVIFRKEGQTLNPAGEELNIDMKPRSVYFYRVKITGNLGDTAVSETGILETGKKEEPWIGEWISTKEKDSFHPVFRRIIQIPQDKKIVQARLYTTGLGLFEVYVNGTRPDDEYLLPFTGDYKHTVQVITFRVENLVCGSNTIEFLTGKGWYMGTFGLEMKAEHFGNRMGVIAELHILYEDGSSDLIATDETWEYRGSDIAESGIYYGEDYNHCLWQDRDNPWRSAVRIRQEQLAEGTRCFDKSHLRDRSSIPIRPILTLPVRERIVTPAGDIILDFGQNFAGYVTYENHLPKGAEIAFDFCELLQDGEFFNGNYREAKSAFVYVSDGIEKTVRPHFTYFGFRYVRVHGWTDDMKISDFTGVVIHSDVSRSGWICTGNSKVNRLYENAWWSLQSNFMDMPTDCPQRNERLGWTGDAQVFAATASYYADTQAFYRKFLQDLREEQEILNGGIPNYMPNFGHKSDAGSVWGDIATILPDTMWRFFGSREDLKTVYPVMRDWVDYIDRQDAARGRKYLFDTGFTFGDWLALDGTTENSYKGCTEDGFISSVYYYHSAELVKNAAHILDFQKDTEYYGQLASRIRTAVLEEYFTPTGRLAIDTQTACVIALKFGIFRDRERLMIQFRDRLKKDGLKIRGGFVGAPLLCTTLAENGMLETAYDFLLNEAFPGWLYEVNLGATTIWERWNSVLPDGSFNPQGMNSLNHYAYGSVMEFLYAWAGGIRPAKQAFAGAIIEPRPDIRLGHMETEYESRSGRYRSAWKIHSSGELTIEIHIPFGCSASVTLPRKAEGTLQLAAGDYTFRYLPEQDFRRPYSEETTLKRLAQDPTAVKIMQRHVPTLAEIMKDENSEFLSDSLAELRQKQFMGFDAAAYETAVKELKERVILPATELQPDMKEYDPSGT